MLYQPHDYQKYATRFIVEHPVAAVLLQMGLGKSVITLTAIAELALERFEVCRVLVIAPLRVARDTWPAEIQKWDHLKGLTYSVAVGTEAERRSALQKDTLIHIINRENVQWLIEQSGLPFQYDMLVIDELSSFKSHQAKRFRALMRMRPRVARVVGLTGTPSSNGLMDLRRNSGCWIWASGWGSLLPTIGDPSSFPTDAARSRCSPGNPSRARRTRSTGAYRISPSA